MAKDWIAAATSQHKGAFKAKAEKAGMTTHAFAEKEKGAAGATGKQARLALTLMGMHHPKSRAETLYGKRGRR